MNQSKGQRKTIDHEELVQFVHELRSPLHCILSFSDMSMKKLDTLPKEKLLSYLEEIMKSGRQCVELVDEIFESKKRELSAQTSMKSVVDLKKIVESVLTQMAPLAEKKSMNLELNCKLNICDIKANKSQMTRVMINLLTNAVKFGAEQKKVICTIDECVSFDQDNREFQAYLVTVSDQGQGIREEDLDSIFEKYAKGQNTTPEGLGMGLAISKEIVEDHGGCIWAENNSKGGASMKFVVPICQVGQHEISLEASRV